MNWKMWVPLVLAIVLGVVAATMVRDVLMQHRAAPAGTKLAQVIVAKHALVPGESLHAEDLATGEVAATNLPDGSFTSASDIEGRVVLMAMGKGQTVVQNLLAPVGTGSGLQALVPAGMRAITVSVDEFSGVGGMLVPGCRVDVLSTFQNENTGGHVARTIVQNVKVQAVGQRITSNDPPPPPPGRGAGGEPPAPPARSVTLLATPEEAEAIELAAATGRPRLILRSSGDSDTEARIGVSALDLSGHPNPPTAGPPVAIAPPVPPTTAPITKIDPFATPDGPTTQPVVDRPPTMQTRTVTVIRAGQESTVTFQVPTPSSSLAGTDPKPVDGAH